MAELYELTTESLENRINDTRSSGPDHGVAQRRAPIFSSRTATAAATTIRRGGSELENYLQANEREPCGCRPEIPNQEDRPAGISRQVRLSLEEARDGIETVPVLRENDVDNS
jgi:hypothetical protein